MSSVRALIEIVARALADNPRTVSVTEAEHGDTALIEVRMAPQDVGKLIGRQGRTIAAIRTLAATAGDRQGKKVTLEVREPARGPQS